MIKATLYHVQIPMIQPFAHAVTSRNVADSLILMLQHHNGVTGLGECVPRSYVTGENIQSVMQAFQKIDMNRYMEELDFSSEASAMQSLLHFTHQESTDSLNMLCALEMASLDLIGKQFNRPLQSLLKQYCDPLEIMNNHKLEYPTTQVLDFSLDPLQFIEQRHPFHTIKIKADNHADNLIQRVSMVRKHVGDAVPIIIDANMSWSLPQTIEIMDRLKSYSIAYYEEPLQKGDLVSYQKLKQETHEKVMLDESLCSIEEAKLAIAHRACDAFNIRISKCGGLLRSITIANLAIQHGLTFQIGAQVAETGPLIAAGRVLAGTLNHYFAFEAGQPDRHYANYIVTPMPLVDRKRNIAFPLIENGLGITLHSTISQHVKQKIEWDHGAWQPSTTRELYE